jgi:hypothetical protein
MVPGVRVKENVRASRTAKSRSKNSDSKAWSFLGTFLFIVVAVFLGRTCGGIVGRNAAERDFANDQKTSARSTTTNPPSSEGLSYHEVAGLTVKLPRRPSRESLTLPPEAKALITTVESYQIKEGKTMIGITHAIYKVPEVNLEGSADGAISQVRNLSGVTGFKSTKESVTVDGLSGRKFQMSYRNSSYAIDQHGLVFGRGNEAWQVQIVGDGSSHSEELETLAEEVFSSVRLRQ